MATEKQFEFFKFIYLQEEERHKELIERGKVYLAILTFYIGFLVSNFSSATDLTKQLTFWDIAKLSILLFGVLLFIVAFVFVTMSLSIYKHEVFADPKEIIENFGETAPTDSDFYDDRIIEFSASTIKNRSINNSRAKKLKYATILMLLGITVHIILLFLKLSIL